jgi:hypothetical protein
MTSERKTLLNLLGQAEETGVGPACEAGSATGNDEEAACEAASPVEQSTPTAKQGRGSSMSNGSTTTSTSSTPIGQHTGRDQLTTTITAAVHEAMRKTLPHKYTPDLADVIAAQTIANLTGVTSAPCPVFRDCTDTTPGHYDHHSGDVKVVDDADGSTILDAGMVANSGSDRHAIVYLRNAEFTDPASVRAKTAEVRAFLDRVDALAERVFADQQTRAGATA